MTERLLRWLTVAGGLALVAGSAALSLRMQAPTQHFLGLIGGYGLMAGIAAYVASAIARNIRRRFRPARYGPIDFAKVGFQLATLIGLSLWLCLLAIDWLWDRSFSEAIVDGSVITLVGGVLVSLVIGTVGNIADLAGFNDRFGWEAPAKSA